MTSANHKTFSDEEMYRPGQWIMPLIPAAWEAEIRRIMVQSQHQATVSNILSERKN
jgi:hypothetical protein